VCVCVCVCARARGLRQGCAPATQEFFRQRFCHLYSARWRQKLVEHMKYKALVEMLQEGDEATQRANSPFKENLDQHRIGEHKL
jgi:hypothetical protein